jgi:hypothetical protein
VGHWLYTGEIRIPAVLVGLGGGEILIVPDISGYMKVFLEDITWWEAGVLLVAGSLL